MTPVRVYRQGLASWASVAASGLFLLTALLVSTGARAFDLTSYMEIVLVEDVSTAWTTVPLENSYANAIPVCTYVLGTFSGSSPAYTNVPAVTRIQNISATSFQLRIQGWEDTAASTNDVHCVIVDEGVHTLPDGRKLEAHTVISDQTTGQHIAGGGWQNSYLENVSGDLGHTFSSPVVLGQVISHNDNRASVFYSNDCESRQNNPFQSNFADGICVGKHIGMIAGTRAPETLGYIVAEAGSGTVNNIFYELALGSDSVAGNNAGNTGDTYGMSRHHTIAVLHQAGEDGGNGSWAVLYGDDPLDGNNLDLAVDEEIFAGDASRNHTNERVYYWAFAASELTLRKTLINDSGGTASLADFTLSAAGIDPFSGISGTDDVTDVNVTPGTYSLSESIISGYDATAWSCTGATSSTSTDVVLQAGDDAVCTITNNDRPFSRLTLLKDVANNSGGTAADTDFSLSYVTAGFSGTGVEGDSAITGAVVPPGIYTLSESALAGYELQGIKCSGSDNDGGDGLTIADGESVTCVFINNDIGVDISIVKTVDDISPNIGQTVTFTLLISNSGPNDATNLSVEDVVKAGFSYVPASISGADTRSDSDPTGTGLTWVINSLPTGASTSVSFQAVVQIP